MPTYLERLRRLPVSELLVAEEAGDYPAGVPAAVLLSLQAVRAGDRGAACAAVMDLAAVLSPSGIGRDLVHAAAAAGLPGRDGPLPALAAEAADAVLARLAGASLLTFSVDGTVVTAHRLVMRVIRDSLAAAGALAGVCQAAAGLLDARADALWERRHADRAAARDLAGQLLALAGSAAACPPGTGLDAAMIPARWWALAFLNELGDSTAQAITVGEQLAADLRARPGPRPPRHPGLAQQPRRRLPGGGPHRRGDRLARAGPGRPRARPGPRPPRHPGSRGNLAIAYRDAGRTGEAITLHEQALAARERLLGPDHPDTLNSRDNLAIAYQEAGRTGEAITLHEQALAACERLLGPDHPNTLHSRGNLAEAYRAAGRTGEAITLHEQVLADRERVLGPDHPTP